MTIAINKDINYTIHMLSDTTQANFRLPVKLLEKMRRYLPKGQISEFVEEAIDKGLKRLEFQKALKNSFGAWGKRKDLGSTQHYIRAIRRGRKFKGYSK